MVFVHFLLTKDYACLFFLIVYLMLQMTYYVVCPDIDPLTTAAADFFQQLGTGERHERVISVVWSYALGTIKHEELV